MRLYLLTLLTLSAGDNHHSYSYGMHNDNNDGGDNCDTYAPNLMKAAVIDKRK